MSDLDWWFPAVGASAAAITVLITVARVRRRRRAGVPAFGEKRIEIVAIDERNWK